MEYKKGDRVKHPSKPEWGLGEVLTDSNGLNVKIFFVGNDAGEKTISLSPEYIKPEIVPIDQASHPVLDNLKISKTISGVKYKSLPQSVQYFLEQFPEGFYGTRFKEEERDYKDKANELANEILGQEKFSLLLKNSDYSEIVRLALKLVNKTNLISPFEKMALKDGLDDQDSKKVFSKMLNNLLYGGADLESRFNDFIKVLEDINASKWTIVSYFLFIFQPEKYMFVKPTITQYSSELCGYEINYNPQLNWKTYKSVLNFSTYLFDALSEQKPRDMIDIQSFMWCIAPKV
ncbi:DUF3553 domain-containing protein [Candidatus Woesearchaeota archaeon]|jgi:hypothetical protein|nr:DUF3553 domain-containing protein [Candidatus Woesearchaeota archaeon]MBT4763385.1 DUF3553 domain-containing protein [bacterium]MBT7555628.1 DUF3553 domain-containing protein [Candidatus Woesearchaeota archaeon]